MAATCARLELLAGSHGSLPRAKGRVPAGSIDCAKLLAAVPAAVLGPHEYGAGGCAEKDGAG